MHWFTENKVVKFPCKTVREKMENSFLLRIVSCPLPLSPNQASESLAGHLFQLIFSYHEIIASGVIKSL